MLEESGLESLSLRAIAARVGVSHTAPRNHFGSLRGLLTAIAAEGFRRHADAMRDGLEAAPTREARLTAAMEGYVGFAAGNPALFQLMFSPMLGRHEDPRLSEAARDSYGVLAGIAEGLDWDKADAEDGQQRTEWMLWSFVHGYATLMNAGQFAGGPGGRPALEAGDIIPDFRYRPRPQ